MQNLTNTRKTILIFSSNDYSKANVLIQTLQPVQALTTAPYNLLLGFGAEVQGSNPFVRGDHVANNCQPTAKSTSQHATQS